MADESEVKKNSLSDVIGDALSKIDKTEEYCEIIEKFWNDIGMTVDIVDKYAILNAFIYAIEIREKINYEHVINFIYNTMCHKISKNEIKIILQTTFKNWLKNYPELVESNHNISIMNMLKLFSNEFK